MDNRDVEKLCGHWYESFNQERKFFALYDEDDELIEIPAKWEVCSLCDGKGTHVNPGIDAHGLTAEDFESDFDFYESYLKGEYDECCYRCEGRTTEPVPDEDYCTPKQLKTIENAIDNHFLEKRDREAEIKYGY